jgi:protein translocase SecG subunit
MLILLILQIIVTVLLIGAILLQSQGGGISPVFGGGGEMYRSRQNIEKFLVGATVVLIVLIVGISIALLLPR